MFRRTGAGFVPGKTKDAGKASFGKGAQRFPRRLPPARNDNGGRNGDGKHLPRVEKAFMAHDVRRCRRTRKVREIAAAGGGLAMTTRGPG